MNPSATAAALGLQLRLEWTQRFAGSALGVLWTALLPLLQLALFGLVFVHIFKARDSGLPGVSYLEFLAIGMWPWMAFADGVTRASGAFVENAGLITKVRLTPWHLIMARVLVAFAFHFVGFLLVLGAFVVMETPLHATGIPAAMAGWGLLLLLALATGTIAALSTVFIRDMLQLLPQLLTAMMFLTPILYPAHAAPRAMQDWLACNPLSGAIGLVRGPLLGGAMESPLTLATVATVAALLALTAWSYRRLRPHLVDFL